MLRSIAIDDPMDSKQCHKVNENWFKFEIESNRWSNDEENAMKFFLCANTFSIWLRVTHALFFFLFLCMYLVGEALKYDKNFKGPLQKRSCTDVCCLLIFLVFLGCWGFIAHYGKWKCGFFESELLVNRKVVEMCRFASVAKWFTVKCFQKGDICSSVVLCIKKKPSFGSIEI